MENLVSDATNTCRKRNVSGKGTYPEKDYKTRELAKADVYDYIEVFYNQR